MTNEQILQRGVPALFVMLWSTGFVGAKLGLPYAEPLTFLLTRFAIVIVLLATVALSLGRPWPTRPVEIWHLAIAGVLLHGGYLGGVFSAIHRGSSAGVVALIVGMQPILTALIGRLFFAERITREQTVGLALGFVGVWLVVAKRLSVVGLTPAGVALSLLALVSITLGTLHQKRHCSGMDLWSGSVVQFLAASIVLLPLAAITESMEIAWSGRFAFALAWLVLVLSVGAISLLNILIRRGAATRVAALFYLTPPTTALLAYLVFDERLTPLAILGMGVTAVGVWLVVRR